MDESSRQKPASAKLLSSFAWMLIACGVLFAVCWFAMGRIVTQKIAVDAVKPLGLACLAMLFLILHASRSKQWIWAWMLACPFLLLLIAGNGVIASMAIQELERPYVSVKPLGEPQFDLIVLLGGGTSDAPNGSPQVNASGDRLVLAARMFHLGKTEKIICTGSRIAELTTAAQDGAERARVLLTELGVPSDKITLLEGRNTREEIESLNHHLNANHLNSQRVGILTSAWHMPRAMHSAEEVGLNVLPLPADFQSRTADGGITLAAIIRACVPNAEALRINSMIFKEKLGTLLGR